MEKDKFLQTGLLEQYVLGLTDEEESRLVEKFASAHPDVQAAIDQMQEGMDNFALQYAALPKDELRARAQRAVPPPKPKLSRFQRASNALLLLVALSFAVLAFSFHQGKVHEEQRRDELARQFADFREDCEAKKAALQQTQELYAFLNHEATTPVRLRGTKVDPTANAVVYMNLQVRTAYINTAPLSPPPDGKVYQLWADVEGKMISMGLIKADLDALQSVPFIDHAESLNITIEPMGGSELPTVALLLANGPI